MTDQPIRFDDGAAYERMMGMWSRLVGEVFLDWLAPASNLSWVDVGCGNGAFTELLVARTAPKEVHGIDPSAGQIAYAKERAGAAMAQFQTGDAMDLPYADSQFDAAVMALVIFFVPEPAKGLAEMVRVTRPGGLVSAYAWDVPAGGLPLNVIHREMRAIGLNPPLPPRAEVSTIDALTHLWRSGGLEAVETHTITVQRSFADFDELWECLMFGPSIGPIMDGLSEAQRQTIRDNLRKNLPPDDQGRITYPGVANAVKGRVAA